MDCWYRLAENVVTDILSFLSPSDGVLQLNLADEDVATVASAVKAFFKELDEPLLTRALYPRFMAAARRSFEERQRRDAACHFFFSSSPHSLYTICFFF